MPSLKPSMSRLGYATSSVPVPVYYKGGKSVNQLRSEDTWNDVWFSVSTGVRTDICHRRHQRWRANSSLYLYSRRHSTSGLSWSEVQVPACTCTSYSVAGTPRNALRSVSAYQHTLRALKRTISCLSLVWSRKGEAPGAGGALRDPMILPICCERRAGWRIKKYE
ncbi:hypothetical protein CCMA1212_000342 [Trichoderma ghanense]|uniref:Uncharacterized protein n=1 Tax=Trichoderma ghanense TaxID=65468 RepID=A0ABY2HJA0_9HYPO